MWQKLNHPHPSVYKNPNLFAVAGADQEQPLEIEYLCYDFCRFTLLCIKNTLLAVGCNHIKTIHPEELMETLYRSYQSYRSAKRDVIEMGHWGEVVTSNYAEAIDSSECHIYAYDRDQYCWNLVNSTSENGASGNTPSVAVVGNKVIIVRNSMTMHIVTFP